MPQVRKNQGNYIHISLQKESTMITYDQKEELLKRLKMCPWPAESWTMTIEEYVRAVPDESLRTSISGMLMRRGWELAEMAVQQELKDLP